MIGRALAHASVSSRHLQQALFLLLAVLVTLIIGQQYSRWNDSHAASNAPMHAASSLHFTQVSAHPDVQPTLQFVDRSAPSDEASQQPRWVF